MTKVKTILITGVAGFIASHIADLFIENNYRVIGVDNLKNGNVKNINKKLTFVNLDLNNENDVKKLLKKYQPTTLIHQASNLVDVELSIRHPALSYQDLIMTTHLIEEAQKYGLNHVIFASSANVYGNQKTIPIKESAILAPTSPYGLTKISIENYIKYFSNRHKIDYTIFRYFNVYGERQNAKSGAAIPTFIRQVLNNEPITIRGGKQIRDFVYVKDVALANFLAETKKVTGIYNVGSGKYMSVNDVVHLLQELVKTSSKATYKEKESADLELSQASIAKIKKALGWKPTVTFAEGLARTVQYYQKS